MPVSGCGNETVTPEQVKFHPVRTGKACISPVGITLRITLLKMFIHIFPVHGEQVDSLVRCIVKPCKMVDSQNIYLYILPVNVFKPQNILCNPL